MEKHQLIAIQAMEAVLQWTFEHEDWEENNQIEDNNYYFKISNLCNVIINSIQGRGKNTCAPLFHQITVGRQQ